MRKEKIREKQHNDVVDLMKDMVKLVKCRGENSDVALGFCAVIEKLGGALLVFGDEIFDNEIKEEELDVKNNASTKSGLDRALDRALTDTDWCRSSQKSPLAENYIKAHGKLTKAIETALNRSIDSEMPNYIVDTIESLYAAFNALYQIQNNVTIDFDDEEKEVTITDNARQLHTDTET